MMPASNQQNTARRRAGLVLALIGLISATGLLTYPIRPVSAQTVKGSWSVTGSLNQARTFHTATLLPDGKILIAGGGDNTAELYDTETLGTAPTVPRIISASVSRKNLIITGENFEAGAVILINGQEQKTRNDDQNPQRILIGDKAGKKKKIKAGYQIQVRNPDGSSSEEFTFTGS